MIGAAQPVALDGPQLGNVFRLSDGIVRVAGTASASGQRYTVWSYAPRPEPAQLARVEAAYPATLDRFLDLGRTRVEPFGAAGRDARVDALFDDERYVALWPYEQLWDEARRLRAGARTPYGAVVAIETWLRTTGGFAYDESPPATRRPAAARALRRRGQGGYCQHFAGAMALMLRFLGIPARVAAGFTSGKPEDGGWTVTDHNAHAWVEVWFPDYGWLAFDPTPGRGTLAARTAPPRRLQCRRRRRPGVRARRSRRERRRRQRARPARPAEGAAGGAERRPRRSAVATATAGRRALWALLLVALAAGVGIGAAKLVRRRAALPDAGSAPARSGRAARARRLPGRPGRRRQPERDARRSCTSSCGPSSAPTGRAFAAALAEARFGPAAGARRGGEPCTSRAPRAAPLDPPPPRPAGAAARSRRAPVAADVIPPAVVMAAGLGTRLRPLTERYAKPVLPIDGKPVIAQLLRELAAAGCRRVTVVVGHLGEQVPRLLGDGSGFGVELRYVTQPQPDGSADAVRRAGEEPPYLVAAADTVFPPGSVAAVVAG